MQKDLLAIELSGEEGAIQMNDEDFQREEVERESSDY